MALIQRLIPGMIVTIIGLALAVLDYYKFIKPVNLKIRNSIITDGVIISDETDKGYVTGDSPFVEYRLSQGSDLYNEVISQRGRITRLKSGEHVPVYYDMKNPSEAMLADAGILYRDAIPLGLFAYTILFLFGIPLLVLGVLNRDSFFDLSGQLENGLPPGAKKSVQIISGICVFLMLMKLIADIPVCMHTTPYMFIIFIIMFVLNIVSFLLILRMTKKD